MTACLLVPSLILLLHNYSIVLYILRAMCVDNVKCYLFSQRTNQNLHFENVVVVCLQLEYLYVTQPCLHTDANTLLRQSERVYYLSDFIISIAAEICLLEVSTVKVLTVNVREGTKRSCQILLLTLN